MAGRGGGAHRQPGHTAQQTASLGPGPLPAPAWGPTAGCSPGHLAPPEASGADPSHREAGGPDPALPQGLPSSRRVRAGAMLWLLVEGAP